MGSRLRINNKIPLVRDNVLNSFYPISCQPNSKKLDYIYFDDSILLHPDESHVIRSVIPDKKFKFNTYTYESNVAYLPIDGINGSVEGFSTRIRTLRSDASCQLEFAAEGSDSSSIIFFRNGNDFQIYIRYKAGGNLKSLCEYNIAWSTKDVFFLTMYRDTDGAIILKVILATPQDYDSNLVDIKWSTQVVISDANFNLKFKYVFNRLGNTFNKFSTVLPDWVGYYYLDTGYSRA